MAYEVYTFGGGDALEATFHMVNAVLGTDTYLTALKISLGFGLIWVLLNTAFKGKFSDVGQWVMTYMLIFNALFLPKAAVVIVDRVDNGLTTAAISNVPWGLAYFAHISSKVGDVITRTMELASSLPNDLQYSRRGALFGSTLVERSAQFKIVDSEFAESMNGFVKQCVFYDILNGMYTLDELASAPNIWAFLTSKRASPYRAFKLNNQYVTCKEGIVQLSQLWNTQIDKAATVYGQRFFRKLAGPEAKAQILAALPTSYQYITGIAEQAGNLMRQNMMINAFESAVANTSSELDANAAITNYMQTRAETKANSAYKATARQASKFVPLLRVVFECLYYGAFPLLLLAAMLPMGAAILRNYFLAFVWIQSWGPLYAVLNILMTLEARTKSMAASTLLNDSQALTLMTKAGIETVNADIATLAGYLSISIPFIAVGIAKGASSFTHLATSLLGVSQSAATRAAEEGTTGNINFGNSTQGVHAYNNTSANQTRISGHIDQGSLSQVMGDGSILTYTPDGRAVLSARGAHSDLPGAHIDMNRSIQQTLGKEAASIENKSQDESIQSRIAQVAASAKTLEFAEHAGLSQGSSDSFRTSEQTSRAQEAAKMKEHVETLGKELGISVSDSSQLIGGITSGFGGAFLKMLPFSVEFKGQTEAAQKNAFEKAQRYVDNHNLKESLSKLSYAIVDGAYETSDKRGQDLRDSIRADLSKSRELSESSALHYSQAESLRKSLSETETQGASFHGSLNQRLFERLSQQRTPMGGIMGTEQARILLNSTDPNGRSLVNAVAEQIVQEEVAKIKTQAVQNRNLAGDFKQEQQAFKQAHNPENFYHQEVALATEEAAKHGVSMNTLPSDQHKVAATQQMALDQKNLKQQSREQAAISEQTKQAVKKGQDEWKDSIPLKTIERGIHNAVEAVTAGAYKAKE